MTSVATAAEESIRLDDPTGSSLYNETQIRSLEDVARNRGTKQQRREEEEIPIELEELRKKMDEVRKKWEEKRKKWEEDVEKWAEKRRMRDKEVTKRGEERRKWEDEAKKREEERRRWKEEAQKWDEERRKREEAAKGSIGLSGHFDSLQLRRRENIRPYDWKEISFYGNEIDVILTSLNTLDFDHHRDLRVKSYICQQSRNDSRDNKIIIEHWWSTIMYAAGCDWIALYLAKHPEVQWGSFDTIEAHPPGRPQVATMKYVTFARKYTKEEGIPNVAIWFNKIDVATTNKRFTIMTFVSNVTRKGFMIHVNSCSNTLLHEAGVSWISYPKGKKGIDSADFLSEKTLKDDSGGISFNSGSIRFDNRQIKHVFVGLKEYCGEGCANTRLKLITEAGDGEVQWRVETWEDSVVHKAAGAVIVLE